MLADPFDGVDDDDGTKRKKKSVDEMIYHDFDGDCDDVREPCYSLDYGNRSKI